MLTESPEARTYRRALKHRLEEEGSRLVAECSQLKTQSADLDPVELYAARQAIRPAQEKTAEKQLENAIREKPSLVMLLSAKQEVSLLLGESAEERQACQMSMQRQAAKRLERAHSIRKRNDFER